MKIQATFTGKNNLGYIKGHVYILNVGYNSVIRLDESGYCIYNSIKSFLANWTDIKHLD